MVAHAPATPWIPKDDLLLKTAIEAGASLESLARGAVEFSRRFTLKELLDRWHTLLYDPIISAEATARMVELERSSKANKADNSKEAKCDYGKRKAESIRRCYYAMRKRICNEQLNQGDLSFLVAPSDSCFITEAEGPGPHTMLGDPMQTHYGFEGANFDDLHHVFPEVLRDNVPPCSVEEYPSGQQNALVNPIPQNILHKEVSQMDRGDIAMASNRSATAQTGPSKELPGHDIFQANGIQADSVCDSKGIMCTGFGDINSTISECETSFHHLQYASTPPAMPDWKSNEGISAPDMPEDGNMRGNDMQAGNLFCVPGDGNVVNRKSEYDVHAESELNNHMSCAVLKNSADCKEGYFAELSDSLFNFTSDDDMLMIDGGKDVIDKTYLGLSSLLLNSPDDLNEDPMPDIPKTNAPAGAVECHGVPPIAGLEENNEASEVNSEHFCDSNQINSESQIPTSPTTANSKFPEVRDGVIWCTLNTEDPEIPCNDHLPLLSKPRPHSTLRRTQSEAHNLLHSGKDNLGTQTTMKRDAKRSRESHTALHTTDLGATLNHSVDDFGVKFGGSKGETHNRLKKSIASQGGLCQSSLVIKNESSVCPLIRHPPSDASEKFGQVAAKGCVQTGCSGTNQEGTMSTTQNQEFYALDSADPLAAEPGGKSLLSDDEQFSESDTDIPYFSDVESMILDMDLVPEAHDYFYHTEVAKYQNEDAKRVIIRLEQNAHAYMQRALAVHGALAILYGRHSKHYIKKSEVLLGRGTHDVPVDIDLAREGRANKISRRQAIIKMDQNGTFALRNMGKCSIYVNNKEVFPGLTLGLHSNCLIEIRGMPFIFETSQALIRKYLDNAAPKSEVKSLNV